MVCIVMPSSINKAAHHHVVCRILLSRAKATATRTASSNKRHLLQTTSSSVGGSGAGLFRSCRLPIRSRAISTTQPTTTSLSSPSLFISSASSRRSMSNTSSKQEQEQQPHPLFRPTCDLYDDYLDIARVPFRLHWKSYGLKQKFCGYATTIKCYEDNSRIKEILSSQQSESESDANKPKILVVDGGGSMRCALLGDMIAKTAVENAWEGIVVYGCVRDVDVLRTLNIGIMALGNLPRKSTRRNEGQINIPISIGNALVNPGDFITCDNDGILILNPKDMK